MKMFKIYLFVVMALSISACGAQNQDSKTSQVETEVREAWSQSTETGTVTAIVNETREITLVSTGGELVTIVAGPSVERFDEISVGDIVTFDYLVYLKAEFRAPTAEEVANPLVIGAEAAKAPEGMDPAGAVGAMIKAVVTIEALNRPFMLATVKGPGGNYLTVPMEDAEFMETLHIGQVLILTYAEASVVSLTKIASVKE